MNSLKILRRSQCWFHCTYIRAKRPYGKYYAKRYYDAACYKLHVWRHITHRHQVCHVLLALLLLDVLQSANLVEKVWACEKEDDYAIMTVFTVLFAFLITCT